jgi:rfaE bifunctional protein kinase chain/domain/rfaE bifunctional protein nucleotidyltransferase chain/domain
MPQSIQSCGGGRDPSALARMMRASGTQRMSKIWELGALAQHLETLRAEGRRVVQCHGVFDPLHVGHIRYFKSAAQHGDVLVVTVTPDRFVNRGPNRPVFTEALRAEAIAALECVDFVAINTSPMAIETIKLLKPNAYVKGSDYRDASKDRSGGILLEREAVESVGGELVFTDELTFSASNLINHHFGIHSSEVSDFLSGFSKRHAADEVLGYLDGARNLKVLVIGETIIDEYQYCSAIGKSSKEPMLAIKRSNTETFAGGILAVGNHVANFSDQVSLVTQLGGHDSYADFIAHALSPKIRATYLRRQESPTIVKRRFVESYYFHKLLEVYEMNDAPLTQAEDDVLCDTLRRTVPEFDVVIVVDYGHGMLSQNAVQTICDSARFLTINVQSNAGNLGYHTISRYPRADYICVTESEIRLETRDKQSDIREMLRKIARDMSCQRITVTRGSSGCLSYRACTEFYDVPALAGQQQIVDRVGAGDAFLSVAALYAAQDAPMDVVGFVGNAVGAQAVATVGNRSAVDRNVLLHHIESLLK